ISPSSTRSRGDPARDQRVTPGSLTSWSVHRGTWALRQRYATYAAAATPSTAVTWVGRPRRLVCEARTAPSDWWESSDHRYWYDSTDPAAIPDPIEKNDANEPMLATDATEPTLPTESTEPCDAMDSSESSDHRDQRERCTWPVFQGSQPCRE